MYNPIQTDLYNQMIIEMYSGLISRRQFGFMDKEEVFITNNLAVIIQHALNVSEIFTEEQFNNLIYILNRLTNG